MIIPIPILMNPKVARVPHEEIIHILDSHSAALTLLHQPLQVENVRQEAVGSLELTVDVNLHRHTTVAPFEICRDGGACVFGKAAGSGVVGSHFGSFGLVGFLVCWSNFLGNFISVSRFRYTLNFRSVR